MSALEATADRLLDTLAGALRLRVEGLHRAEQRRASFVFREDGGEGWRAASLERTAWPLHLAGALHQATDPAALDLLVALRTGDRTVDEIAVTSRPGGDRLAAGVWIGDLAAAGLVSRDLETDRVSLAPLGEAIVDLVEAVAGMAAASIAEAEAASGVVGGPER